MLGAVMRSVGVIAVFPAIAGAQQIRGVVVEDSSNRPVTRVRIELLSADSVVRSATVSTANGWFELPVPRGGAYLVRASHEAYRNSGALDIAVGAQEVVTVVMRVSGGPIPIDPLIVQARSHDRASGFRERSRKAVYGRFITRDQIDKLGGHSLSHIMRLTPEVRIEQVRDGVFVNDGIFMRSFGDLCMPAVYLDGISVPTGRAFDINALISAEAIEGIEVYRSVTSAPMELRMPAFGENWFCGVVAIWSRPIEGAPLTFKRVLIGSMLAAVSFLLGEVFR
jgi:hypothetical protein